MTHIKLDDVQTITGTDGRPTHVVVPWSVWTAIAEAIESDEALFQSVDADEETFPAEVARRLVSGESPTKVFREYRGLTQAELAHRVGSSTAYVSQIETGARRAGDDLLRLIARALRVDYEDIAIPAFPSVEDMPSQPGPRWNSEREFVSCTMAFDGKPQIVAVSWEALADLERGSLSRGSEAEAAFERHLVRIKNAAARAVAEGRRQRDGVLLLVTADF